MMMVVVRVRTDTAQQGHRVLVPRHSPRWLNHGFVRIENKIKMNIRQISEYTRSRAHTKHEHHSKTGFFSRNTGFFSKLFFEVLSQTFLDLDQR
jgi:hypothetical protein